MAQSELYKISFSELYCNQFRFIDGISRELVVHGFSNYKQIRNLILKNLKVQSCKLYNNKHMIASTQRRNSENFALIAVLVFKLLSRKVLFINRKDNRNC